MLEKSAARTARELREPLLDDFRHLVSRLLVVQAQTAES